MSLSHRIPVLILLTGLIAGFASAGVPVVDFSTGTTTGNAPFAVTFTDLSSGSPTGWAWYFGDEDYTGKAWVQQNGSAAWSARVAHSSVALPDGSIVVMGGVYPPSSILFNDVWRSADGGVTWINQTGGAQWSARYDAEGVALRNGKILLMGGSDSLTTVSLKNDVWISSDKGVTWSRQTDAAWDIGRTGHSSSVLPDGSVVIMGGCQGTGHDVWRSTDNGTTWTAMTYYAGWSPRVDHSSVTLPDGRIILTGGRHDETRYNDVWQSEDLGATWTCINNSAGWSARYSHTTVALPNGGILLIGGTDDDYADYDGACRDVWYSGDGGVTWACVDSQAAWTDCGGSHYGRTDHKSVVLPDGNIILTGGTCYTWRNDVWGLKTANATRNPTHVFTMPGSYNVTLQAYNSEGYHSVTKTAYITVLEPAPTVSSITPNTGMNTAIIQVTNLTGTNFPLLCPFGGGPTVNLTRNGFPNITATNVTVVSSSQITCTFDLTGKATGQWNVTVTNPDGQSGTLPNGFAITGIIRHFGVFRSSAYDNWIFTDNLANVKYRNHYGMSTDKPLAGDINTDGMPDRAVYRNGNWIVDLSMDGTVDSNTPFGMPTDIPLLGNFNNAGILDRAVFRNGLWIVDWEMDGTVDSRTNFGMAGDIPLVGDFNNDAALDRAVFRNGQWIVDFNMDGTVDSRTNYGMAGDIPLVGYFNDDTLLDRAVFRNGEWIMDYNMDGSADWRPRFGTAGDKPLSWVEV